MNLKGKIVIITLVAIVALVGVGFATFTFTNSVNDSAAISGNVAAAIEAQSVQVKNADGTEDVTNLYIICASQAEDGIYWSTTNDSTAAAHKITQLRLVGSVNEDDNDIVDFTKYTGTFTSSITGVPDSTTWINIASFTTLNVDVESTSKNADVVYNYTLPALSYKAVPGNVTQVNALETEVNAISITIQFTFTVKSVTAA